MSCSYRVRRVLGKTRLLHEVQALARRSGIQVYHGRCQEDVVLPYLPFVEALRMQLEQTPGEAEETSGTEAELMRQLPVSRGSVRAVGEF